MWQDTSMGPLWRLRITSSRAQGLRVHFKKFNVGQGYVWVHTSKGQVVGPYRGRGLFENGSFGSMLIFGDTLTVEYLPEPRRAFKRRVPFRMSQITHILENLRE